MDLLEDRTAVFIVRVWCERGARDAAVAEWRGSVEHVRSGKRAVFRHLDAVCDFMRPHLLDIGVDAQQRFWERIASVLDTEDPQDGDTIAIDIPAIPSADASTGPMHVGAAAQRSAHSLPRKRS